MIRIIADVNVGKKLIVQLGHLAQKLSLYFLFRDIARIEECDQVAAFRILIEPEIRPAPEDSAVLALAQTPKTVNFPGCGSTTVSSVKPWMKPCLCWKD